MISDLGFVVFCRLSGKKREVPHFQPFSLRPHQRFGIGPLEASLIYPQSETSGQEIRSLVSSKLDYLTVGRLRADQLIY